MSEHIELGDIFRAHFADYVRHCGPLPYEHYKVANAIVACRTEALGGHLYRCADCAQALLHYNSCRNRHCPTCQRSGSARWVQQQATSLLPVPYFHVVFTVPQQLHGLALANKSCFYASMMAAVGQTLLELGANPRRLGGTMGFIAVLHTWGQNLMFHPHVHCVVPAGALDVGTGRWKRAPAGYLFPVAVLSALFKGKLLAALEQAAAEGRLCAGPDTRAAIARARAIDWVVYAKPPFAGPQAVLKYLSRYTHRVAISNSRLLAMDQRGVTFRWKDYADAGTHKTMCLQPAEFIRRFLLHVVPRSFVRIRHYGFLSNRGRKQLLPLCRAAIQAGALLAEPLHDAVAIRPALKHQPCCPRCHCSRMLLAEHIPKKGRYQQAA